jgi:hypothetical protein
MEHVNLVRVATSGLWLSTERVPQLVAPASDRLEALQEAEDEPEDGPSSTLLTRQAVEIPTAPNAIFLGHGKNKRPLEQLKGLLDQYRIPYKIAIDEPSQFRPISQKVAETMKLCDAAILIFTADEEV